MKLILGSRSPRRQELLARLFPQADIEQEPPQDEQEESLDDLYDMEQINQAVMRIAEAKAEQVHRQREGTVYDLLLTADTVVAVAEAEQPAKYRVLGKPEEARFSEQVQDWFEQYYWGKSHRVISGVCLMATSGQIWRRSVQTEVRFCERNQDLLNWYLASRESLGKAGGYAIQGMGSLFVEQVTGSLSNVIGLPLKETRELIHEALG